ncbi:hypothetical protein [Vibrio gallaecicus]|nr:hypothetical protein [Vibrio gallaecicus]MDN3616050.1 hypothetical protein [Vibrio gallaecicus]
MKYWRVICVVTGVRKTRNNHVLNTLRLKNGIEINNSNRIESGRI